MARQRSNKIKWAHLGLFNAVYSRPGHLLPWAYTDADGQPLGSWRMAVMPWMESGAPGFDLTLPWNDPANFQRAKDAFGGSLRSPHFCFSDNPTPETNTFAVIGPDTAFDDENRPKWKLFPPDLIILVEVAHSGLHWMEPGDLHVDSVPPSIVQGVDGKGVHVAFADGAVWYIGADVPLEDLKKFFTLSGAIKYDRATLLEPYLIREQWDGGN